MRAFVEGGGGAYRPPAVVPAVTEDARAGYRAPLSSREWPMLTIYRDGLANLNGLATELLRRADSVELVDPPAVQAGRGQKAWQLHAGGSLPLVPHGSRVGTRFRARRAAGQLFAGQPADTESLRFALTPEPGQPDRFRLLPL